MKPILISSLSPAFAARNRAELATVPHPKTCRLLGDPAPVAGRLRQKQGNGLNKTEAAFLAYLQASDQYADILPQSVTLLIANGCRYTPDFLAVDQSLGSSALTAYEVKGFMRDDAGVKLKVAASKYPWIKFILVWRKAGAWQMQEILP